MEFHMNSRRTVAVAALIPVVLLPGAVAYGAESPTATGAPMMTAVSPAFERGVATSSATPDCGKDVLDDKCVFFDIAGLPRRVDAGDGWHEFTITVGNKRSGTLTGVDVTLIKQVEDLTPVMPGGDQNSVDLQTRDRSSGKWRDVDFPEPNIIASHYATTDLVDGKPLTIQLRVRVREDFPFTVTKGDHVGGVYLGAETRRAAPGRPGMYWQGSLWSGFSVFRPAANGGDKTSSPAPDSGSTSAGGGATSPGNALPDTGTSSKPLLLAGVSTVTLAIGAGAVYAARRRRPTGA